MRLANLQANAKRPEITIVDVTKGREKKGDIGGLIDATAGSWVALMIAHLVAELSTYQPVPLESAARSLAAARTSLL